MMRYLLRYIFHDCFVLQTEQCNIVFDYWKDPLSKDGVEPSFLNDLEEDKPLYVLVSHFHKDHFNKDIFGWRKRFTKIHYIISRDVARHARYLLNTDTIYKGEKVPLERVDILSKGHSFQDRFIKVDAFGSTDIGNSYALWIKGAKLSVFHAGDLNCWTWRDESTPREIASAENAYRSELEYIAESWHAFDVVMFPVDSRIGTGYEQGARMFLSAFRTGLFIPMHFTLAEAPADALLRRKDAVEFKKYGSDADACVALTNPYDAIMVK